MMGVFVVALLVISVVVVVIVRASGTKLRMDLALIAERLKGTPSGKHGVIATIEDRGVVTMLLTHTDKRKFTHFEVELLQTYPLALFVRRHVRGDDSKIARGDMVDIRVGDLAFDDEFLVEAAPADVAKRLLDGETRSWLRTLPEPELSKVPETGRLRLVVFDWVRDPDTAETHVRELVRIASRVRDAYAEADAAIPTEVSGAPFREIANDDARRRAAWERVDEVEHVWQVQSRRRDREKVIGIVVSVVAITAYILVRLALER